MVDAPVFLVDHPCRWRVVVGDAPATLRTLPAGSVQCCITSPPYWGLRDYGVEGQLGLERTPEEHVARMVEVFRQVRRVLADDGTLWLNLGDSYCTRTNGSIGATTLEGSRTPHSEYRRTNALRASFRPDKAEEGGGRPHRAVPSLKHKDLIGVPWRIAFALQADGWWLRSDIIWSKPNPMPESVTDRPTKAHEYLFLLAKSERYYYDSDAIREPDSGQDHPRSVLRGQPSLEPTNGLMPEHRGLRTPEGRNGTGRNCRSVWTIPTQPFPEAHFATFPEALVKPCILAGSRPGDKVLDPFAGSGTVGAVALRFGRDAVLIDLNPRYVEMARHRCAAVSPLYAEEVAS